MVWVCSLEGEHPFFTFDQKFLKTEIAYIYCLNYAFNIFKESYIHCTILRV